MDIHQDNPTELVPLAELRPRKNPRKNAKAIAPVAESLRRFGFVRPLVANRHPDEPNTLIIGHTAWAAAKSIGLEMVPVRWVSLPSAEADAAALADNKLGEIAGWDDDLLREILSADGFDIELAKIAGFGQGELDRLLAPLQTNEAGGGLAVPVDPITQPGDLWVLGRHRLLCGDCTDPATVARVLDGAKPALLITDPPYGVNYDPAWRKIVGNGTTSVRRLGTVLNDDRADWTDAWRLAASCNVCYVWCAAGPLACVVAASLETVGFELKPQIVWAKRNFPIGRGHYHVRHEPCWYGTRKGHSAEWVGGRQQSTVWDDIGQDETVEVESVVGGHSCQKPLECMQRPMRNHVGDVYEPFAGSGTTLIAAEHLSRRCFALELNPAYCDLIVARWEAVSGEKAVCHTAAPAATAKGAGKKARAKRAAATKADAGAAQGKPATKRRPAAEAAAEG